MAYVPVNEGAEVDTLTGDVRIVINSDIPLYPDQSVQIRRVVPKFENDPVYGNRYEGYFNATSTTTNAATFEWNGFALFNTDLELLTEPTEILVYPLLWDDNLDDLVQEFPPFSFFVNKAAPSVDTDIPVKDGLFRVWDTRSGLSFNGENIDEWVDKVQGDVWTFSNLPNASYRAGVVTRFRDEVPGLLLTGEEGSGHVATSLPGIQMPQSFTIMVIGYTYDRNWSTVDLLDFADIPLAYQNVVGLGQFEGLFKNLNSGAVFTPALAPLPSFPSIWNRWWIEASDHNTLQVDLFLDDTGATDPRATVNTDLSQVEGGILKYLFPDAAFLDRSYLLGALIIWDRVLTEEERISMNDYVYDVWFDIEV